MTEEQYKKTFIYRHNKMLIAFYAFLCTLFSNWVWAYLHVTQLRTNAMNKAKQDYEDYVEG